MKTRLIAGMLIASVGWTQAWAATVIAGLEAQAVQAQTPAVTAPAPAAAAGTIEVPAGTKVPLTLVNPIMSLSTKPGATVRAVVAFPVTVGNQLAIPAGTFVDGQLIAARAPGTKAPKGTSGSALQIHFTQLVYANGYTVPLDALKASVPTDAATGDVQVATADEQPAFENPQDARGPREHGPGDGQFPEPTPLPPLPPLSRPGPNPVVITAAAVGGFALLVTGAILLARHHVSHTDAVLYDAGWQFSMSLTSALTLDRTQVMDAAAMAAPAS